MTKTPEDKQAILSGQRCTRQLIKLSEELGFNDHHDSL